MKTNQEYKNSALSALSGNWSPAVVASVIFVLIAILCTGESGLFSSFHFMPGVIYSVTGASLLLSFFILAPAEVGLINAFKNLYETGNSDITTGAFRFATYNYLHIVWVYFIMSVKLILWTLLLIIPGIIKAFCYAMTPYIMVEHPEYSAQEAIDASCDMMRGHLFDLFWLYLSFIGWAILSVLTCGIGFFWLIPYMATSQAAFYFDLKTGNI